MAEIQSGVYRHFKGGDYWVLGVGINTENGDESVVYYDLKRPGTIWIRPVEMFTQTLERDGRRVPRFTRQKVAKVEYVLPTQRSKDLPEWFLALLYSGIFSMPASQFLAWLVGLPGGLELLLFLVLWPAFLIGWLLYERRRSYRVIARG